MSVGRIIALAVLVSAFIFAKIWVLRHPKTSAGIILGAILLIFSEPAQAK